MSRSSQRAAQVSSVDAPEPAHVKTADRIAATDTTNASDEAAPGKGTVPTAEIELKLLCDPKQLADFSSAPIITQYARDEGKNTDLTAIYYDTPGLELRKAGSVLRVRTDGKRFVMTLKSKRRENGNALERTEWKAPVQGMEPDLTALSEFLPAEFFARIENEPLQPVFTTEVRRPGQFNS